MSHRSDHTGRPHRRRGFVTLAAVALLAGPTAAHAALTTGGCLALKRKAWANLRKCQGTEEAKLLRGKVANPSKCMAGLQNALAKITARATSAAVACRYGDNGDQTVTDYDTGLQWELKDGAGGGPNYSDPHDLQNLYSWGETDGTGFLDQLNCESPDGTSAAARFAGHCDWRLPTIAELQTILLAPPCFAPCIDPIFGPTAATFYLSSTTRATIPDYAWLVSFGNGALIANYKGSFYPVRAVRGAL